MDFSQIMWLESVMSWSIGGVSLVTIILIAIKIIKWINRNSAENIVKKVVEILTGKTIDIDLTALAEKKFEELNAKVKNQLNAMADKINAQSDVLVDIADIVSYSKLASEAQVNRIKEHTAPIRTKEPAKPKETVKIKLEPLPKRKPPDKTQTIYID